MARIAISSARLCPSDLPLNRRAWVEEQVPELGFDSLRVMNRPTRRILSAGTGMAAFTALEGLACGNPVSPRYEEQPDQAPPALTVPAEGLGGGAAQAVDPPPNAGAAEGSDAGVSPPTHSDGGAPRK